MRKGKTVGILLPLLSIVLVAVILFSVLQIVRSTRSFREPARTETSKTVVYDGVEYFPRQDIDVFMILGIDKFGVVEPSTSYNNDGEADVVLLLIFDHADACIRALNIDRDTMTEMSVLGVGGKQAGTFYGQLALAQTYGSGLEDSCENTRNAVSHLLGGVTIDHYAALRMDAIAIVNDAVGGVQVEVREDFRAADSDIPMGPVRLHGQQAIEFVRFRRNVGDQLNASRMERQQEFLEGFIDALREEQEHRSDLAVQTYDAISDYIVTDCSSTVMSSMLERCGDYSFLGVWRVPGESRKGEEHMEFYTDAEALEQLVLELFYAPK